MDTDDSMDTVTTGVSEMHINNGNIDLSDLSDLPNILIVKNLDEQIFNDPEYKARFEALFHHYDPNVEFQYLKSFRRARVVLQDGVTATKCRLHLHETQVGNTRIKCYFAQPLKRKGGETSPHLHPPVPEKQFLISPPASPPIGWEPVHEGEPIVNYDLLSAMAHLAPGETHELHPASADQPGIVVHVCEDPNGYGNRPGKIVQTKRPEMS